MLSVWRFNCFFFVSETVYHSICREKSYKKIDLKNFFFWKKKLFIVHVHIAGWSLKPKIYLHRFLCDGLDWLIIIEQNVDFYFLFLLVNTAYLDLPDTYKKSTEPVAVKKKKNKSINFFAFEAESFLNLKTSHYSLIHQKKKYHRDFLQLKKCEKNMKNY